MTDDQCTPQIAATSSTSHAFVASSSLEASPHIFAPAQVAAAAQYLVRVTFGTALITSVLLVWFTIVAILTSSQSGDSDRRHADISRLPGSYIALPLTFPMRAVRLRAVCFIQMRAPATLFTACGQGEWKNSYCHCLLTGYVDSTKPSCGTISRAGDIPVQAQQQQLQPVWRGRGRGRHAPLVRPH